MSQQKYLHDGAGREGMQDSAGRRIDFRSGFTHFDTGDPGDFTPQRIGGTGEQKPVKSLNLCGTFAALSQRFLNF